MLALPEKSVLLVEDSTLTRFSSRRVLEERGYLVDEAASGQEALVKARGKGEPYDLVILDIHLPGMDGLAVLENLKRLPEYRYVPVMVVTIESNVAVVKKAIDLGAVEYLCKPYSVEELVRRVEKLIGPGARREATPAELLHKVLRNEINRASRGALNVALVLARSEGLGKGKIVECARQARRRLREIDTVIELSKSTLALVLPHTGKEGAQVVITKLAGLLPGTWSYGVAVYPDNGKDGEELFAYAEASLKECWEKKTTGAPAQQQALDT
ncbi:two-component system response regulator [Moorella thermoacetica]|uniref:Stage 0 sporulation protein A homolog n=1 Tax=Moorella thermoacetica (strain ATCC 39073 / JCM 9320) TaxID=264732 RepID=Q2RKM8_MOOTA|nr:response regulator [Moorella thermoacetica]AKX93436.1 putative transcriptional regulatory protein YedW [Moorella thermoacetica]AKX96084.1 putative transcriptional regulatory protein YedW [Moorella thermoacetica]OIQ55296.1 putative transcriptional regulatory protein YedW [Moorella thermoacetica]QCZ99894.1 putative transcriptional regulatory protein YedW [Moorella thermoacetica]TYL07452.1 Regulator of RpoS [Moorella thermoacetica]